MTFKVIKSEITSEHFKLKKSLTVDGRGIQEQPIKIAAHM